ncbi:MAG: PHP domain-containing protein [Nitrospiraceae bacterium]
MTSKALRGIVHVHSKYSYDGKHSLAELADATRGTGLDFVCITEHSDTLDAKKVAEIQKECGRLSDPNFLMVPGIEFTCEDNVHILGFGARELSASTDLFYVNDLIQRNGWVSVMAHPSRKSYRIPAGFLQALNGLEVWNSGYDGRFFPNARSFDLYMQVRTGKGNLVAVQGADLHALAHLNKACIVLDPCELQETNVLDSLRAGRFSIRAPWFRMSSRPEEHYSTFLRIHLQHELYISLKRLRGRWHKWRH